MLYTLLWKYANSEEIHKDSDQDSEEGFFIEHDELTHSSSCEDHAKATIAGHTRTLRPNERQRFYAGVENVREKEEEEEIPEEDTYREEDEDDPDFGMDPEDEELRD